VKPVHVNKRRLEKRKVSMEKKVVTIAEVRNAAEIVAQKINHWKFSNQHQHPLRIFGVPKGGWHAVIAVLSCSVALDAVVTYNVNDADVIVDDVIDSGATRNRYNDNPEIDAPFFALFDRPLKWLVFPWEVDEEGSALDIPTRLLQYIGEDTTRGGLLETPARILKAWKFWTDGYNIDPASVFKTFTDGAELYNQNQMVVVKNIPVWSMCEHHLAPFFGTVCIAYIPDKQIVGLSKFSRLVDIYARRLQVQERLTNQIAQAITDILKPKGSAVLLECRHSCMESRGVQKAGIETITSDVRGLFLTDQSVKSEFLRLIGRS